MAVLFPIMLERIARKLGVLPVGEPLSPEDGQLIREKCLSLQAQLEAFDIVTLDFNDGIDDSYADIIADMGAALLVDDFMLPEPKRSKLASEGVLGLPVASVAERRLRKLLQPNKALRPVKAEYY
jgi:hypothetical protein